jgi:hypothetical protein
MITGIPCRVPTNEEIVAEYNKWAQTEEGDDETQEGTLSPGFTRLDLTNMYRGGPEGALTAPVYMVVRNSVQFWNLANLKRSIQIFWQEARYGHTYPITIRPTPATGTVLRLVLQDARLRTSPTIPAYLHAVGHTRGDAQHIILGLLRRQGATLIQEVFFTERRRAQDREIPCEWWKSQILVTTTSPESRLRLVGDFPNGIQLNLYPYILGPAAWPETIVPPSPQTQRNAPAGSQMEVHKRSTTHSSPKHEDHRLH